MLKQGLNYVKSRIRERIPAASKNIFMDRCVRAPCVLRRKQNRGGCVSKG